MASFIATRAPDQCRSHHQKMEKKYGGYHHILENQRLDLEGALGKEVTQSSASPVTADVEPSTRKECEPFNQFAYSSERFLFESAKVDIMDAPISADGFLVSER